MDMSQEHTVIRDYRRNRKNDPVVLYHLEDPLRPHGMPFRHIVIFRCHLGNDVVGRYGDGISNKGKRTWYLEKDFQRGKRHGISYLECPRDLHLSIYHQQPLLPPGNPPYRRFPGSWYLRY